MTSGSLIVPQDPYVLPFDCPTCPTRKASCFGQFDAQLGFNLHRRARTPMYLTPRFSAQNTIWLCATLLVGQFEN